MLFAYAGAIEVRADGKDAIVAGRFPYNTETELARGRFETFAARALRSAPVVHLLAGHDYGKPLASTAAGSLTLRDGDDALGFEARIAPGVADTSYGRDTLALVHAGLSVGLSPGFRVAPDGETVERRSDGVLRTVRNAELFELSIVTVPAYSAAQVEARSWLVDGVFRPMPPPLKYRWRR